MCLCTYHLCFLFIFILFFYLIACFLKKAQEDMELVGWRPGGDEGREMVIKVLFFSFGH